MHTAVDIAVVAVILISAVLAFIRGLTREALSLGTWILAVYLAFTQYPHVSPLLEDRITNNPGLRDVCAGGLIFIGVLLILLPIGFYLRGFVKGEQVTAIDRSLGFVFGAGRGYLLMAFLYLAFGWVKPEDKQPAWLQEANTKPALAYGADLLKTAIPVLKKGAEEAKKNEAADGEPAVEELKAEDKTKSPTLDDKVDQLKDVIKNSGQKP